MAQSLTISVINYRTAEMTIECAKSALPAMEGLNAHLVIVDNFSDDGSVEKLQEWRDTLPDDAPVSLIFSPENTGFCGGHNLGIQAGKADYYFLLNSDALVKPDALKVLLKAPSQHPDCGLFAPRLEYEDGKPQISAFRFFSPISELIRGAASEPVTRLLKRYDVPLGIDPEVSDVEWVSFAAILIRHEVIESVGELDEGYFLYFDDVDYCYAARKQGWRIALIPDARIVHFRGGSAPVKSLSARKKRLPAYYYASRTRFLSKAYGRGGLLLANIFWCAGRAAANLRRFLGKPVPSTPEHEIRDIWINFFTPYGDRHKPQG